MFEKPQGGRAVTAATERRWLWLALLVRRHISSRNRPRLMAGLPRGRTSEQNDCSKSPRVQPISGHGRQTPPSILRMTNTLGDGQTNEPGNPKAYAKAAKAYAKASRPWYKKKRWWIAGLALVFVIAGMASGSGGDDTEPTASAGTSQSDDTNESELQEEPAKEEEPEPDPEPEEPEMTSGQENALRAGQNYIDIMPFSKAGLIRQLSSSAGDGYSKADATFAANNVDADWNAEAVEAATNYLDIMPMSRDALIRQLSSSAGDQFTKAQAIHAANKVL